MRESGVSYRRSSFCSSGACVEVGFRPDGRVAVRDAKRPFAPHPTFTTTAWTAFLYAIRAGEFQR